MKASSVRKSRYESLIGERFGKLTVTGCERPEGTKHTRLVLICDCGQPASRLRWNLTAISACDTCSKRGSGKIPQPWMPVEEYDRLTLDRLKRRIKITESGCWEWQGFRRKPPRHYGDTNYRGRNVRTHRLMYQLVHGPIPPDKLVMHSCDNPPCINPDHLSLGTHLQNMSECREKGRYYYANQTHCKHGHEFNDENTYIIQTPGEAFGLRSCKACQRARHRIKGGWPEDLAYSLPPAPPGFALVRVFKYVESSPSPTTAEGG